MCDRLQLFRCHERVRRDEQDERPRVYRERERVAREHEGHWMFV